MSSILKALQKLEKEKSAKEERPVRLAWEVMRPDRSVRSLSVGLIMIVVCALGVGIGGTALWMSRSDEVVQSPVQIEESTPKRSAVVASVVKKESKVKSTPESSFASKPQDKEEVVKSVLPVAGALPAKNRESISRAEGLQLALLDHKGGTGSVAVINDLPVMEGTSIEGYRVVAILPDKVLLEKGGKVYFVGGAED